MTTHCGECGHDAGARTFPIANFVRRLLRLPTTPPKCAEYDPDMDGMAGSPHECGCKATFHVAMQDRIDMAWV